MTYTKGQKDNLSLHFNSTDFDCKCKFTICKSTLIDPLLVESLEVLWTLSGGFTINSGFRCPEHNRVIGGVNNSQHLLGKAADCQSTKGYNGHLLAKYAEDVIPFSKGGIGIYFPFVHVDVRTMKARWIFPADC